MSRNDAFLYKKTLHVWEKMPIEGAIHLRSLNRPFNIFKYELYIYIQDETL